VKQLGCVNAHSATSSRYRVQRAHISYILSHWDKFTSVPTISSIKNKIGSESGINTMNKATLLSEY
jgi:hypothetical protein